MKKIGFLAILFALSFGLFAEVKESDLYYAEVFIPYTWFKPGDKRAVLVNTTDRIDPYLSLYTKNGEFDHIKVALPTTSPKSAVWGILRYPTEYDSKFDVEKIEFKY